MTFTHVMFFFPRVSFDSVNAAFFNAYLRWEAAMIDEFGSHLNILCSSTHLIKNNNNKCIIISALDDHIVYDNVQSPNYSYPGQICVHEIKVEKKFVLRHFFSNTLSDNF